MGLIRIDITQLVATSNRTSNVYSNVRMTIGTSAILLAAGTHFYKTANFKIAY